MYSESILFILLKIIFIGQFIKSRPDGGEEGIYRREGHIYMWYSLAILFPYFTILLPAFSVISIGSM